MQKRGGGDAIIKMGGERGKKERNKKRGGEV